MDLHEEPNDRAPLDKETELQERREFRRATSGKVTVQYKVVDDTKLVSDYHLGQSRSISFGGISFVTTEKVVRGTLLAMELEVPELAHPVAALGAVVRSDHDGEGFSIAVEFLWTGIEESIHEGLKKFIRDQLLVD